MKRIILSISILSAFLIASNALYAREKENEPNKKQVRRKRRMGNQPRLTDPNLARKRAQMIRKRRQQKMRQKAAQQARTVNESPKRPGQKQHRTSYPDLKGKAAKQMTNLQKKLVREEAKYFRRTARLMRIRQLAQEESDQETMEHVNKLLQKERIRYSRKKRQLTIKKRDILHKQTQTQEPVPFHQRQLQGQHRNRTRERNLKPADVPKQKKKNTQ